MDEGCDKNLVVLVSTEILYEFLLPLLRFALFNGRIASEMGSETGSIGRDVMGQWHFLPGGQLQGRGSSRALFTTDESSPFVTF